MSGHARHRDALPGPADQADLLRDGDTKFTADFCDTVTAILTTECHRSRLLVADITARPLCGGHLHHAATFLKAKPAMIDLLIRGGEVIDGTGSPRRAADVTIRGDRIEMVGRYAG